MARDREILDAAEHLFYKQGFAGVTMGEIGSAVGISGPAVYRHFATKAEILSALYHEAFDELLAGVAIETEDPQADLDRLLRHHVEFVLRRRELALVYSRETNGLSEVERRQFRRRARQYTARWEAALARVYPDAPKDLIVAVSHAVIPVMNSVAYWPPEALEVSDLPDMLRRIAAETVRTLKLGSEVRAM
ncbi:MAG: hypothetical protein QOE18_885 [Chloroflexota bacterium]|nr:hypothetical protein [Chloroflexota bacterium]